MNPGEKVSHYRIVSLLGGGGMGVVYLAEDLTLGRKVALKFLSHEFARDRMAVERFRREARTASALNHPNICTIYEISEHDGQPFIAMERLEGQSLKDLLRKRRLSTDELITLAIDATEGLDAAHRAGVVHRDIKPGNIFILPRGHAKLLDFGLAKMGMQTAASELPTGQDEMQLTDPGVTMGTVAYMSPEQARGELLDARTDLFSFGVVLYEAVAGSAPFRGSSPAVVFHEILGKNPPAPLHVDPDTPADLDRLIMKALEKDRDVRCQSAAELLADLKRLKRDRDAMHLASSDAVVEPVTAPVVAPAPPPQIPSASVSSSSDIRVATDLVKRHRAGAALGLAALILVAVGIFYARRPQDLPTTIGDLQVVQLTSTGNAERPAISPDGRFVAYVADNGLWIRQTATSSNVQIVPPEPGVGLFGVTVRPDNNFVDFIRVATTATIPPSLWRVAFLGGSPKLLIEDVHSPPGWSPDGRQMAFIRSNLTGSPTSVVLADADGRNQRVLAMRETPQPNFVSVLFVGNPVVAPAWSPDGQLIAHPVWDSKTGKIYLLFLSASDGTARTELRDAGGIPEWIDGNDLLVLKGGLSQLWRLTYPGGKLSRITNDLNSYWGLSMSADRNSLVTSRTEVRGGLWISDGDAKDGAEISQPIAGQGMSIVGAMAWAGDRLLFTTIHPAIYATSAGGQAEELLKGASAPAVTSDGKTLVYLSRSDSSDGSLWKAGIDGQNPVQLVGGASWWPQITPDDRNVIYDTLSNGIIQTWLVPLAGGTPRLVSKLNTAVPRISPDGKWLAFASLETGDHWFISMCEMPACSEPQHVRAMEARYFTLSWAPDGRAIAYAPIAPGGNVFLHPLDGSPERQLTHFTDPRVIYEFVWSHDGKHFAVARASTSQDIVLFRGFKPKPGEVVRK